MATPVPPNPKIYHIVHIDRLESIIETGGLLCDGLVTQRQLAGTGIAIDRIKQRRRTNVLSSHLGLTVGNCVPFYFCPRSVMLYVIHKRNHASLVYRGGQEPIIHLEADLHEVVLWAQQESLKWAFTLSNAGSRFFEDYCDLEQLDKIDWQAIKANWWQEHREAKQAEYLIESRFPWKLVARIGVKSQDQYNRVTSIIQSSIHRPVVAILPEW